MRENQWKTALSLKIIIAITYILLAIFVVGMLFFALSATKVNDADIKGGIGDVFKYLFSDMGGLFSFKFHDASNIVYFSLSGLLYFFILIAVIYLIAGVFVMAKKNRLIVIPGLVASFLVILVFMIMAGGLPKFWAIINKRDAFENDTSLLGPTFVILIFGFFYIISAYILYFASMVEAFKNGAVSSEEKAEKIGDKNYQNEDAVEFEEITPENAPKIEEKPEEKSDEKDDIKSLLKEIVRDIVRDEIARNNANQNRKDFQANSGGPITGATFGGPLVVQYFNGGINSAAPSEPQKEEPTPEQAPCESEPTPEEPILEEQPKVEEEVIAEEAPQQVFVEPALEPAPLPEEPIVEEKKPIIRIPFTERMLNADVEMQNNYNELKNEIMSYGVNYRVSNSGDTFRLHCKTYVKITIAGLSLKLYFALNPDDYKDSTLPIQNAGHKGIYAEIPLVFKVKSGLSMRRCKQLIQDVMDKNGLEQGEIGNVNWVEELRNASVEDDKEDEE